MVELRHRAKFRQNCSNQDNGRSGQEGILLRHGSNFVEIAQIAAYI